MTVDVLSHRPYVAAMRLLLLLSVLLSALTGAGASVRAPGVAQAAVGRSVAASAVAPAERGDQRRPMQSPPALRTIAVDLAAPLALRAAEPLWASRRRE